MNETAQECAGREHNGAGRNLAAITKFDAANAFVLDNEVIGFGLDHFEIGNGPDRRLHSSCIKFAIGLGARPAHGWTFAAVQDAELDSAQIGNSTHKAIEGIDFPHQMAFSEPANGGIAGHGANTGELVSH